MSTILTDAPPTVRDLPPSAKLVYLVLGEENEKKTQQQLARETTLPARTVRFALTRLENTDVIRSRPSVRDARQSVYWVAVSEQNVD